MEIRWSPAAADDLANIVEYIRVENASAAQRIGAAIYDGIQRLADFPYAGRVGRVEGTRELALPPLPFVVIYRVLEEKEAVEISSILHGAQRWPPVS